MYEKIIQTGDLIEIYQYEKEPNQTRFTSRKKRKQPTGYRLKRHINRSRQTFYRKIRATLALGIPAFATLTTVNTTDIKLAYEHVTHFGVALRKKFPSVTHWIGVPEYQKRGAVHFHILIWGLNDETISRERQTRDIQACWSRGYLDIFRTDGSPKIAGYMAKYMSKGMYDNRLYGVKSYFCSRGVLSSVHLKGRTQLSYFKEEFGIAEDGTTNLTPLTEKVYHTTWLGRCHYKSFTTKQNYA